jgi:4-amino-4-deoxy-L-arabinose transferase-like glycosyltransferase
MLFLLSGIILAASTLIIVSLFRLKRFSETVLAWALTAFATIVLTMQAANLFRRLNHPAAVLIIQSVILMICFGLWLYRKRPRLVPVFSIRLDFKQWIRDCDNWPILLLGAGLMSVLAIDLLLIYIVPPNNNDALSIHLARTLKWNQFGSYFPWETPYFWQVSFPVNAQLAYYWTMLFTKGDHFIGYIPCLAGLASALLVYLLAVEMGFRRQFGLFSAAIWLSFPVVQLHLTSVRHDLISTWLFLSCLYFFHRWGVTRQADYLIFSALSLGLVVGTNFSIAAYLPGLGILLAIWLWTRHYSLKQMAAWVAAVVLAFMLFSSPVYISNWIHFKSPVGPDVGEMTSAAVVDEMSIGKYLGINIIRWTYQLIDFSGLPKPLPVLGVHAKGRTAEWLSDRLGVHLEGDLATMDENEFTWLREYQLQEDEAWYGLIGMALIFPTSLIAFIRGIKEKAVLLTAPFIFLVTAMVTASLIRPGWTPYDGRYFMPLAAVSAALLPMWLGGKKSSLFIRFILAFLALVNIVMVLLFNPAKQVIGSSAIWGMNRIDRMTRQSYTTKEMLYLVEAAVPQDGVIGVAVPEGDVQEYGLYGEHFTRKVFEVYPPDRIADGVWLRNRGIDYLLIQVTPDYPTQIDDGYHYVDSLGQWVVYAYQP